VTTIAGGVILDPLPPRRTTRSAAAARLTAIDVDTRGDVAASAVRMLGTVVAEAGRAGVAIDTLAARLGVPPATATAIVDEEVQHRRVHRLADRLVSPSSVDAVRQQVLALVDAHHEAEPASIGIPRPSVREPLGRRGGGPVVDAVIGALVQAGVIEVVDERLARRGRAAQTAAVSAAELRVMEVAATAGLQAAAPAVLLAAADLPPAEGEALLRRLVREARLVKLGDLYLAQEATARVIEDLCALAAEPEPPPIDVGWFKERYGVTRRTAIPLLEMLDRQRVTRRMGDARVLIPRPSRTKG
jgi:selenocysteine-specific elongation factor